MVKKPTLVALSSLMALSIPTVSEKLSTSEMRKNSIKPNAVELNGDAQNDIPETEPAKQPTLASDPDLITVELSQDGTSTVIKNNQQEENKPQTKKKDDFIPEPNMVGSSKLDITKVEVLSVKADELKFKLNSSKLSEEAVPTLKDIKEYIEKNDYVVAIVGYTDSSGLNSYNERLSLKRAESVSSKLIELGLSPTRIIEILGKGDENPVANNETEAGRNANRRVEFRLVKRGMNLL